MGTIADLTGRKFRMLTVISLSGIRVSSGGQRRREWLCKCECGNEKPISGPCLLSGKTVSCGCYRRTRGIKHGMEQTPEYAVWLSMKQRCLDPKNKKYAGYGGRGIRVCDRWLDFANFIADMGRRPPGRMTIERLDNERGYEPGNCKWATYGEQSKNQRKTARNTSGFVGVYRDKNRWCAYIKINGRKKHIGNFANIEDAAAARREVARQHGFKTDLGDV